MLTYEDGKISTIADSWGFERWFNHEDKLEAMMKMQISKQSTFDSRNNFTSVYSDL